MSHLGPKVCLHWSLQDHCPDVLNLLVQIRQRDAPHVIGILPRHIKGILILRQGIQLMYPRVSRTRGGHMFRGHIVRVVPPMRDLQSPRQRWEPELLDDTHLKEAAAVVAPKILSQESCQCL